MLKDKKDFKRITNLYLGPSSSHQEENKIIKKLDIKKYKIVFGINEKLIVKKLQEGKIIGRCVGRMEFGQRALGNRSILADPRNILIKEKN